MDITKDKNIVLTISKNGTVVYNEAELDIDVAKNSRPNPRNTKINTPRTITRQFLILLIVHK